MDEIDRRLLSELINNSRLSLKELAGLIGLSPPGTSERLKRLEERGVIRAFTLEVDPASLGYPIEAIIRIRPLPGNLHLVQKLIEDTPEFGECHKVTGEDCFVARLYLRSIDRLDPILERIAEKSETNTSIVKSRVISRRPPPFVAE